MASSITILNNDIPSDGNTAVIIGSGIAGIVVTLVIIIAIVLICIKRKKKHPAAGDYFM